jgi:hypothetical protein
MGQASIAKKMRLGAMRLGGQFLPYNMGLVGIALARAQSALWHDPCNVQESGPEAEYSGKWQQT